MANPQKENGYTPIANEIMDALAKIRIPGEARQILDVIMRKTYGWRKCEDVISLSQFVEMTGMQKPNICRAINRLLKMNIIIKKDNKNSISYGLQKDFEKWKALSKKIIFKDGTRTTTIDSIKAKIRKRDNDTCVLCGHKEKMLSVHHIDYNQGNNDESNLITLCKTCHGKTNSNYDYWKKALSKMIKTVIKNDKKALSKMIPTKEIYKETITKETVDDVITSSIATFLKAKIFEAKPNHRPISDATIRAWSRQIDLMIRRDKRDPKQIRAVIDWLFGENLKRDVSFVVESAKALRAKYDRIEYQMNKPKKQGSYLTAPEQYEDDEWEREHVHVVR